MSPARRLDFATGRACARDALTSLGSVDLSIPREAGGAPSWPSGFVGAITHCEGVFAAAVAPASRYRAIGIDAEPLQALSSGMLGLLQRSNEQRRGRASGIEHVDLINFSAKESIFKVWYPITLCWLDFLEATVDVRTDGTFAVTIHHERAAEMGLRRLNGTWRISGQTVYTAIALGVTPRISDE